MLTIELLQDALLVAFAAAVMYTDWRWHRIPNVATYPAMLVGLVLAALEPGGLPGQVGFGGLLDHLVALGGAFVLTLPLYATGGFKAGDVKLLMAVGALKGLLFLFYAALLGALLGGVFAIGFVVVQRFRGLQMVTILKTFIPYGVSLGFGSILALLFGVGR